MVLPFADFCERLTPPLSNPIPRKGNIPYHMQVLSDKGRLSKKALSLSDLNAIYWLVRQNPMIVNRNLEVEGANATVWDMLKLMVKVLGKKAVVKELQDVDECFCSMREPSKVHQIEKFIDLIHEQNRMLTKRV